MAITNEELSQILPDYRVMGENPDFDVEWFSPAGEDVIAALHGNSLRELTNAAMTVWADFDPDDHACQIYHAKHYGSLEDKRFYSRAPATLDELREDANCIKSFFKDTWDKIAVAANLSDSHSAEDNARKEVQCETQID